VFMSQSLLVGGLSFEVHLPGFNQETELAIQEVKDIASDKAEAKTYHSVGELFKKLDVE